MYKGYFFRFFQGISVNYVVSKVEISAIGKAYVLYVAVTVQYFFIKLGI